MSWQSYRPYRKRMARKLAKATSKATLAVVVLACALSGFFLASALLYYAVQYWRWTLAVALLTFMMVNIYALRD